MITAGAPARGRDEGPVTPAPLERKAADELAGAIILRQARVPGGDALTRRSSP